MSASPFQTPTITAGALADRLGGRLVGDRDRPIAEVATLADAGAESLTWVGDKRYLAQVATTRAGTVLVPDGCDVPAQVTAIHVADPDLALCTALEMLAPPLPEVAEGIHPDARVSKAAVVTGVAVGPNVFIGPGAHVGPGTQLHAGVYVAPNTRIGRDCVIWQNVVIRERTTIGDRVIIHPNSTIGADGFGYHPRGGKHVKIPQIGRVSIADDVEIGANSCIDRARSGVTRIGRGTKIDNLVQIGHNATIGEDCIIIAQCGIAGTAVLGNHVILAGHVGVADHVTVGDGAVVAAKSAALNSLAGGQAYRGIPAIPNVDFGRQTVSLRRLPELLQQVRNLQKRVEQLESSTDH